MNFLNNIRETFKQKLAEIKSGKRHCTDFSDVETKMLINSASCIEYDLREEMGDDVFESKFDTVGLIGYYRRYSGDWKGEDKDLFRNHLDKRYKMYYVVSMLLGDIVDDSDYLYTSYIPANHWIDLNPVYPKFAKKK